MRFKLATACFIIGAAMVPLSSYAEDKDADRAKPETFVKDSVITTKIKTKLAAENPKTLARISVDTDKDGIVWMSGTVEKQADAEKAITLARNTEGVRSVKSHIRVENN